MPSINGYTVSRYPARIGIKTYQVPGTTTYLPVRSEIAPLLIGFARDFHRLVEPLHKGWCWGYNFRDVTGGSSYSFHAAGIAIDLNAPHHPYGSRNTFNVKQRATINALCKKYGLRWGGNYSRRHDDMHVEVIVPRATALRMVRDLQRRTAPAEKPAPLVNPSPTAPTSSGLDVDGLPGPATYQALQRAVGAPATGRLDNLAWRLIQRRVGTYPDGVPGPQTYRAVQKRAGLAGSDVDGKLGPNSWSAIQRALNARKF